MNYFVVSSKSFNNFDIVSFSAVLGKDDVFSLDLFVFAFETFSDLMDSFSKE